MNHITFRKWLKARAGEDSPIGDLASDFDRDIVLRSQRPKNNYQSWYLHINSSGNPCQGAYDALYDAWEQYRSLYGLPRPNYEKIEGIHRDYV